MSQAIRSTVVFAESGLAELGRHWAWYVGLGIALVVLGIVGLGMSVVVTLASVIFFGWLLMVGGLIHAIQAFRWRGWSGFFLHVLMGILYVVAGLLIVTHPAASAIALTSLLAAFFLVGGLFRVVAGASMRFPTWGWTVVGGLLNILLGILIWAGWPISSFWVIGLFVAIEMIWSGWSWFMLGMAARRFRPQEHVPVPA